jgi:NitT/TauT family transport system substrate-binding protein/putative hydroxymethylpyrimidine transport system substrate-binding protein
MAAGRADFGYVPMIDFLKAREAGEDIQIVAAVVQKPLAAVHVLKASGITRPRDLEGKLVGVSGVSSDEATVRSIVAHDGGDANQVELINIGFNVIQNLVGGRVDGAVGFWNHEGVQLQAAGEALIFKEDDWGIPPYPGIVVFARSSFLEKAPGKARAFLEATAKGYTEAVMNPDLALNILAGELEGTLASELKPHMEALQPVFLDEDGNWGLLDETGFADFLLWGTSTGILEGGQDPEAMYTNRFLGGND